MSLDNSYDSESEDPDDLVIPKSYWKSVLQEIRQKETGKYLGDNVLYFLRLWNRYNDCYFYKLGFTDDLQSRMISLNGEFDCCGRIIIIALCHIKSQKTERIQYQALKKFNLKLEIKQKKKKECYPISAKVYDNIIKFMKKHQVQNACRTDFFESQRYILDDSGEETWNEKVLSRDLKEEKFWHQKIFGC